MSLPRRTLAMNSKTEDFPTPVSPTRTIVYDAFALFFDVVMTPSLRDSTLLEKMVRTIAKVLLLTYLIVGVLSSSLELETFSPSARILLPGLAIVLVDTAERTSSLEEPSE
jgi:hypothetical protein